MLVATIAAPIGPVTADYLVRGHRTGGGRGCGAPRGRAGHAGRARFRDAGDGAGDPQEPGPRRGVRLPAGGAVGVRGGADHAGGRRGGHGSRDQYRRGPPGQHGGRRDGQHDVAEGGKRRRGLRALAGRGPGAKRRLGGERRAGERLPLGKGRPRQECRRPGRRVPSRPACPDRREGDQEGRRDGDPPDEGCAGHPGAHGPSPSRPVRPGEPQHRLHPHDDRSLRDLLRAGLPRRGVPRESWEGSRCCWASTPCRPSRRITPASC